MSLFTVDCLTTGYGGRAIIDGLSFSVQAGTLLGVLGANGSGKTTLMKAVCGILPHTGSCTLCGVRLDGLSARRMAQLCSYIPQRSGVSIDLSVLEVVLMGFNPQLGLLEQPTSAMREKALEALALAGLVGREEDNYLHLSEGQKQLCILARTLVSSGSLLLLDEPESALDFHYRYRMLAIIRHWLEVGARCALVALHDPMLALNFCDELLLLADGKSLGVIRPGTDEIGDMERLLSHLYGPVSLMRVKSKSGREHLIMLKEEEPS